jgi:competence protein ComEA
MNPPKSRTSELTSTRQNANQLATLPGIGPSTANAIVEYRRKNGPFQKIEDIMNVPGIKENKFSQIRNLITVE